MAEVVIRRRDPVSPDASLSRLYAPLLARIYAARGVTEAGGLDYSLGTLPATDQMLGMGEAVALLRRAIEGRQRLLIVGDFDADGATSTAVAVRALELLGAAEVDFLVPNRFEYGYGLTPEIVAVALQRSPDLIVTVDNGISSIDGVAAARAAGVAVVITDHHLPGAELPAADAIINPNQAGCPFPEKGLAGVGVIFYLMLALRQSLRDSGWFKQRGGTAPNLAALLDLVALGTVADVVPLGHTNRTLVAQGLARIRRGVCSVGISALIAIAGRNQAEMVAADLGFAVGPRLNAAGRLDDMSLGIRCLLASDPVEARQLAERLDGLNKERREIEASMQAEALDSLQRLTLDSDQSLPKGLCLYDPDWHEGVIGILASRIKERLSRPVIVFTDAANATIKGSARSIPGVHVRDALDTIATSHPGMLTKFGGHAMAAGMTLPRDRLEPFQAAFASEVERQLAGRPLGAVYLTDGELDGALLDLPMAEALRFGGPWGQGFPQPLFEGEFEVVESRIVGERHLKLVLDWPSGRGRIEAIQFNLDDAAPLDRGSRVRIVYRVDINSYRGNRTLQLMVDHLESIAN